MKHAHSNLVLIAAAALILALVTLVGPQPQARAEPESGGAQVRYRFYPWAVATAVGGYLVDQQEGQVWIVNGAEKARVQEKRAEKGQ